MNRLGRKWVVTVFVLIILAVAPLSLRCYQVHQVSKRLKEIQSLGEPITLGEILKEYKKPARDATSLWMAGFSLLTALHEEDMETLDCLPFVGFADEPGRDLWENIGLAEKYVEQRAEANARLQAAADMGGEARFPAEPAQGFYGFLHPQGLLDAHNLLRLETHLYGHQQDAARCAAAIRARLALAKSLQNSPASTSQMLNLAITSIAFLDLVKFFDLQFSDEDLTRFQTLARDTHALAGLTLQCLATRAEGITLFREPEATRTYFNSYNELLSLPELEAPKRLLGLTAIPIRQRVMWSFFKPWDFHFFVSTADEMVLASRCSWPEAIDRAVQIEKNLDEQRQSSLKTAHLLTRMLVKTPAATFSQAAKRVALSRVFDAGIAVELYRRRHGRTPDRLNELVPAFLPNVPIDPFSGKPVKFAVGEGAFTVYSVGANRSDDGGDRSGVDNEPDIVCCISILPAARSHGQAIE